MANPAADERRALCDLFDRVGPDAPTLCGTWTTRDLAAHLVIRERRPDAAAGVLLKPLRGHTERVQRSLAAKPWPTLVDLVRSGPPRWNPTSVATVDRLVNTVEFFVHHEDVRRATEPWEPRQLEPALADQLWSALGRMGRLLVRRSPVAITARATDRGSVALKHGSPVVTLDGDVGELVLFVFGRQDHSAVAADGPAESVEAVRTASFGL